jgi:hypothetical protein
MQLQKMQTTLKKTCSSDQHFTWSWWWTEDNLRPLAKDFSSSHCVQTGSETHPASRTMGNGVLSLGVKRGRSVTLTPPSPDISINTVITCIQNSLLLLGIKYVRIYILLSFLTYKIFQLTNTFRWYCILFPLILQDCQIKDDQMSETCSKHQTNNKCLPRSSCKTWNK